MYLATFSQEKYRNIQTPFVDDLLLVLERKENETGDPFISRPYEYIIHIALDPDAQKDTALISVQRKSTCEFVCKDISIPLKEL